MCAKELTNIQKYFNIRYHLQPLPFETTTIITDEIFIFGCFQDVKPVTYPEVFFAE